MHQVVLLVGLESYVARKQPGNHRCRGILVAKPVHPSELFDALVDISVSSDGERAQRRGSRFARRRAPARRPNFAARVLVAEDNAVNQEVVTGMLEAMGCRIVSAPNGRTAFRLAAQEKFDIILMDCEMPIMDGIEAARDCIREIEAMSEGLHHDDGSPGRGGRRSWR